MSISPSWVFHVDDVPVHRDTPTKSRSESGNNLNLGYKLNQTYRSPKDATSFSSNVKNFGRGKSNKRRSIMSISPSFSTCKPNDVDKSKIVAISSGTHIQLYRICMFSQDKNSLDNENHCESFQVLNLEEIKVLKRHMIETISKSKRRDCRSKFTEKTKIEIASSGAKLDIDSIYDDIYTPIDISWYENTFAVLTKFHILMYEVANMKTTLVSITDMITESEKFSSADQEHVNNDLMYKEKENESEQVNSNYSKEIDLFRSKPKFISWGPNALLNVQYDKKITVFSMRGSSDKSKILTEIFLPNFNPIDSCTWSIQPEESKLSSLNVKQTRSLLIASKGQIWQVYYDEIELKFKAPSLVASNNTGLSKVENNVSPINEMGFSSISQINEAMVKPMNFGKGKLRYLVCPISFNSANVSTSSKMVFLTQEDDISFTPSFFDQMKDKKIDYSNQSLLAASSLDLLQSINNDRIVNSNNQWESQELDNKNFLSNNMIPKIDRNYSILNSTILQLEKCRKKKSKKSKDDGKAFDLMTQSQNEKEDDDGKKYPDSSTISQDLSTIKTQAEDVSILPEARIVVEKEKQVKKGTNSRITAIETFAPSSEVNSDDIEVLSFPSSEPSGILDKLMSGTLFEHMDFDEGASSKICSITSATKNTKTLSKNAIQPLSSIENTNTKVKKSSLNIRNKSSGNILRGTRVIACDLMVKGADSDEMKNILELNKRVEVVLDSSITIPTIFECVSAGTTTAVIIGGVGISHVSLAFFNDFTMLGDPEVIKLEPPNAFGGENWKAHSAHFLDLNLERHNVTVLVLYHSNILNKNVKESSGHPSSEKLLLCSYNLPLPRAIKDIEFKGTENKIQAEEGNNNVTKCCEVKSIDTNDEEIKLTELNKNCILSLEKRMKSMEVSLEKNTKAIDNLTLLLSEIADSLKKVNN